MTRLGEMAPRRSPEVKDRLLERVQRIGQEYFEAMEGTDETRKQKAQVEMNSVLAELEADNYERNFEPEAGRLRLILQPQCFFSVQDFTDEQLETEFFFCSKMA